MHTGRVVVVGSINVDLVTRVERHVRPGETILGRELDTLAGGKGANQAVAARAAGAMVLMSGCVGADAVGQAYLRRLAGLGIDCSHVRVDPDVPTGHAFICVADDGENAIVVIPGANGRVGARDSLPDDLAPADVVVLQLEIPPETVSSVVRTASSRGARVVVNMSPYAALPSDVVAAADPLIVNEHEASLLADSDLVPASLLVTFGAAGASWDGVQAPGAAVPAADVLDTTGAGDAFCGALAASLAAGLDRSHAMAAALAAGAEAVKTVGAQPDSALRSDASRDAEPSGH
jgi:ribokinase